MCIISALLASGLPQDLEYWTIYINVRADFPSGTQTPLHIEVTSPVGRILSSRCEREDCLAITVTGQNKKSESRPSHLIMKISAYGFDTQTVNTGIIAWSAYPNALPTFSNEHPSLSVTVKFRTKTLPTFEHLIRLASSSPKIEVWEASVNNPTDRQLNLTAIRVSSIIARHFVSCYAPTHYVLFEARIKIKGSRLIGSLRRKSPPEQYAYELTGVVDGVCGEYVSLKTMGEFNYLISPNERAIIRLQLSDDDRDKIAEQVIIEAGRSGRSGEFTKAIGGWEIEFQADRQLWLSPPRSDRNPPVPKKAQPSAN